MSINKPIVLAFAAASMVWASPAFAQNSTTGAAQGVVSDSATGESLAGVTVVATSPAMQQSQTAVTDGSGRYKLSSLPPGTYLITFYYGESVVKRSGINISVNKTAPVYLKMTVGASETIVVKGTPTIDTTSTNKGITLDENYTRNIPVPGRSFEATLGAAAGSQGDALGVSFSGSTSLENSYVVDGVNTTGLSFGTVGSPIINDFIKEIEIITGGYQAEYGRATGGVVNVVTKSGSNEFHGTAFSYFSNGAMRADSKRVESQATSIDVESNTAYDLNFGFDLGGPIIKDKLWFYVGFAPRLISVDNTKITKRRTDCRTINPDGTLSTPAGSACSLADAMANGDGAPDEDPDTGFLIYEELDRENRNSAAQEYQFVSKINYALSPEHQGQATFSGTPFTQEVVGVAGAPTAVERQTDVLTTDLSLKWTSKFNDNKTEVTGTFGWHRSSFTSKAADPQGDNLPRQDIFFDSLSNLAMLGFESQATLLGCTDNTPDDPYPLIENCPDDGIGYSLGGVGAQADELESRVSMRIDAIQRVEAAGNHEIKIGADFENNVLDRKRLLSGNAFYQTFRGFFTRESRWVQLAPEGSTDPRFDNICDVDQITGEMTVCDYLSTDDPNSPVTVQGNTFNWSAYLQDSWQILPNVTFNAGVRYEEQRLRYSKELQNTTDPFTGRELGTNAMVMKNMIAPRLGATWDWTKEGRSKLYAHAGRFYESIPMDINDRSFGGETLLRRQFDNANCTTIGQPDGPSCDDTVTQPDYFLFGSGVLVAPGIKPQYLDEIGFGVEYELFDDFKLGLEYQHRRMGRVLEDVSTDNADTYIIANPGEWDSSEERKLEEQIASLPMGDPERDRLEGELEQYRGIRIFDKPRRDYNAVTVSALKRFSRNLFIQGSYTYSRTEGNFPGLFSADNGQVDPNITSQYDLIELLSNRDGPLPQDRPHYFKLDAYRIWTVQNIGEATTGIRFRALSGIPRNALARHYLYGPNESFILPRGAMGRTESDFGLDIHLGAARDLGRGMKVELFADFFSVFNTQGTFSVDRAYTQDSSNPIVGGEFKDLIWAKLQNTAGGETADPVSRNPNFQNTAGRYSPFSARIGARLTF